MDEETAGKTRGMIRRVVIKNLNDSGATQTASAQIGEGIWHDSVEVLQPYGIANSVPEDGALGIALAVGADEGDLVILPLSNPSARLGNLKSGDSALYNNGGDYMLLKADGTLEIAIGGEATLNVPNGMTITAPHVRITGDLRVDGGISSGGNMKSEGEVEDHTSTMQTMRNQYNEHGHPDAVPRPGPQMD